MMVLKIISSMILQRRMAHVQVIGAPVSVIERYLIRRILSTSYYTMTIVCARGDGERKGGHYIKGRREGRRGDNVLVLASKIENRTVTYAVGNVVSLNDVKPVARE